jgi:CxxC motif-containing protein (DUF1111 family)
MNVVHGSNPLRLALLLAGAGCGSGSVGALPADPELDEDVVSAASSAHRSMQASLGDPLPGLSQADLARFTAGQGEFEDDETPDEGLGPVFNDTSCARCHAAPALGGSNATLETRFGTTTNGHFDPMTQYGGSLIQARGIGPAGNCDFVGETIPPSATIVSPRRTTPLFGLGLVDAVPESTFGYVAGIERVLFPDEAGRIATVHDIANDRNAVGRFGWKNQVPTLHQFAGDAYLNEMGITNPEFPNENCPGGDCTLLACNPLPTINDDGSGVIAFADFMTLLAPPPRKNLSAQAFAGKVLFAAIGCTHCHWATFRTGRSAVDSLSYASFHPYSDFLLHDMGSLGDGIELGDAKGGEFRTAPLWGISGVTRFLHDGRAATIQDAVLAHDGQARRVRDRFASLSARDQSALLAFVSSL